MATAPRTVSIGRESGGRDARVTSPTAASYQRMRKAGLPAGGLTSTTRDWNTQQRWHNEWKAGKRKAYAAPPSLSSHCKGTAVDFGGSAKTWMQRNSAAHGWRRTNSAEDWHFVYFANLDKRKSAVTTAPAKVIAAVTTLRRGSRGSRVKALQAGLNRAFPSYKGTPLALDGVFGPRMEGVIRDFQNRSGLKVDGKVGPVTASALRSHGIKF